MTGLCKKHGTLLDQCTKCEDEAEKARIINTVTLEPAAPEPLGDSEGTATQVAVGPEPFGYIDGRGRFFYAHDPYYKDTNAGMPRVYSAATVEALVQERNALQDMVLDTGGKLAAMTQERDEWQRQSGLK